MKPKRFISVILVILSLFTALSASARETMPYAITVDLTNQIVTIYSTADGSIVRQMLCSTAKPGCNTPEGVFEMPQKRRKTERQKWYYIAYYRDYVQWSSRITGNILFHSLPYTAKDEATLQLAEAEQFGYPASHGCIRLLNDDSKFIAQNCLPGTMVRIYSGEEPQPELRELLFEGSYTKESGLTYEQFLGMPEDPNVLGRFSSGQDVENLQYRLRALGFYADEITGIYGTSTITAVKQLQKKLDCDQNGQVDPILWTLIFSSDAPIGTGVTIAEGMSGPIVRQLQENLAELMVYEGEIDGIYDVEVIEAVAVFQSAYGYVIESGASPIVQQAIAYEASNLKEYFAGKRFTCEKLSESVPMASISANARVRVRSGPTTDSEPLDRVSSGEQVLILEPGERWSKVQHGSTVGYINNKYLVSAPVETFTLHYSAAGSSSEYVIGTSSDEIPANAFSQRLATDSGAAFRTFATVSTGSDETKLNLRDMPASDGAILAEIDNGAVLKVHNIGDEWTYVGSEFGHGFLMNQYLDYHTETIEVAQEEESSDVVEEITDQSVAATVNAPTGYAEIFDVDSDDANKVGILPHSTEITLLALDDGWCLIDYNGHRGYMHEENVNYDPDDLEL